MQLGILSIEIQCPYCWQQFEVEIDNCGEEQQYIEDCQVCCRPINFQVSINEAQQLQLQVSAEDDA